MKSISLFTAVLRIILMTAIISLTIIAKAQNVAVNLFPKKMEEQYSKLMDMLSVIIARLDRMDELNDDIAAMARRHIQYGVRPAHYKLVGNALLWTLRQGLGQDWTLELEQAWTKCYSNLADTMMRAAELKKA